MKRMTIKEELAAAMFPDVARTPEECVALYLPRTLSEGARVTRIAPSPTGYLHLGVFFTALINRLTADASKGIFYFRLEDTDKKQEVEGGAEDILRGFNDYGLTIDEGFVAPGGVIGDYGPYQQSLRGEIYRAYVKRLVEEGKAYPCFCTEEQRRTDREKQENRKLRTGYYGEFAHCRRLSEEEALRRVRSGSPSWCVCVPPKQRGTPDQIRRYDQGHHRDAGERRGFGAA